MNLQLGFLGSYRATSGQTSARTPRGNPAMTRRPKNFPGHESFLGCVIQTTVSHNSPALRLVALLTGAEHRHETLKPVNSSQRHPTTAMGANQSSTAPPGSAPPASEVKTSYYTLLSLDRTATDDDIKKAYRRKALELHPDRNYGDVDRATRLFAEVQAAYEVLSDPQERAWYDSHEQQILRGEEPGGEGEHFEHDVKVTTAEDILRMVGRFHGGIDHSDSPTGFFGFLRETFEGLAREEQVAADWEGGEAPDYPSFGHKADRHEDVVKDFYSVWMGFSTRKTFAWKDKWRLSDAPNRDVRRLMEKENKKLRQDGVREFNDAVRSLVAFVRKRDPRYVPDKRTEAERQQALKEASAAQAARARAANEAKMNEALPEWATRREPDEIDEESEEEVEEEEFECVACKKTFKSERQWEAHEKSKKHQKAVAELRRKMRKENAHLHLDEDVSSSGAATPLSEDGDESDKEHSWEEEVRAEQVTASLSNLDVKNGADEDLDEIAGEDEDNDVQPPSKTEVKSSEPRSAPSASTSEDEGDSDYAPRSSVASRILSPDQTSSTPEAGSDPEKSAESQTPKLGKAAQKRAKKAAKQAELDSQELKHKCAVCNAAFPSKTRLFQHIDDYGHAAPVSVTKGAGGGKAKGKGKKR